jgi:hypothetical protein
MSYDLVVVGMGSGGLVAAEFAAGLGLRVAAVDRARIGGDCLWTGCVPSKALLASAKVAHTMRTAHTVGITSVGPHIDLPTVWRRVRAVQASIAATDDNPQRYRDLGVELVHGVARLTGLDRGHRATRGRRRPGAAHALRAAVHRQPPAPTAHHRPRPGGGAHQREPVHAHRAPGQHRHRRRRADGRGDGPGTAAARGEPPRSSSELARCYPARNPRSSSSSPSS